MAAKEVLAVRVDAELIRRLDLVAEAMGESRSEVAERILFDGIGSAESSIEDFDNPFLREVVFTVLKSPTLVGAIAKMVGKEVTPERMAGFERRINHVREHARAKAKKTKEGRTSP